MSIINSYSLTNTFETNTVANKGLMEIGGYALPGVIMANNKIEARERGEKAALAFSFSFLAPLLFLPALNKSFLKMYKITKNFNHNEAAIMHLSKEYLSKDSKYMLKGIEALKNDLKTKGKFKNIEQGFNNILNDFKEKEDDLKNRLIKVHHKILLSDFIISGALMGSIYWVSNAITQQKTGRNGFSAEYEMANKDYVENKAKKYKNNYTSNLFKSIGILATGALGLSLLFKKGMLAKGENLIKKHAQKFDYKEGVYMSRLTLLAISLFGDVPNTLLSSRDNEELKYNTTKNIIFYGTFFGGDVILNNITSQILDKTCKNVKLVNSEKIPKNASLLKKITAPLYTMKELEKKTDWAPEILEKTKKFKAIMFWSNFIAVTAFMGFGTPYLLNKLLKDKVAADTKTK